MNRNDSLNVIHRQLCALEDTLRSLHAVQERGGRLGVSLAEARAELNWLANSLRSDGIQFREDPVFHQEATLKLNALSASFETIAGKIRPEGFTLASERALPELFGRLAMRHPSFWKLYESVTTVFGIACMITVPVLISCFCAGILSFASFGVGGISGANGIVFLLGVFMGLGLHEFSHGMVLANNGIRISRVGLVAGAIAGGFVEAEEDDFARAAPEVLLRFNATGIGCNSATALIIGAAGMLCSSGLLLILALGNLFFGAINSLPVSPLDGGWVYEDLVKRHLRSDTAKTVFLSGRFVLFALWLILFTCSVFQQP
ncbi:MAG: hypothetical protein FWG17_02710 [Desulfovibrionaceae bacterium]|nr:hypothetical protein [Desulfovibrionaceae bacterium]